MDIRELEGRLKKSERVLVGIGEEWQLGQEDRQDREVLKAYEALYQLIKDKDYFIITMATDAVIFDTALGNEQELVAAKGDDREEFLGCENADAQMVARMEQIFPKKDVPRDTRKDRIVAPCGNDTWQQCSLACTKDIWEPGEVPDGCCPHCGAPLIGNTIKAQVYIEEGYLPYWERYTRWLAGTLNRETLILELGVGFGNPGVIRFPFEKLVYFNQKAFLCRVNGRFPQIAKELEGRAEGVKEDSKIFLCQTL